MICNGFQVWYQLICESFVEVMEVGLLITYIIVAFLCFASLHLFIRYAYRLGLSDQPNHRSSHDYPVVRGGGIVFGLGWLASCSFNGSVFNTFNLGLLMLMVIGFWDDIRRLSSSIRLIIQLFSVLLLVYHFDLFASFGLIWTCLFILLLTYLINVFNFMDGINGILGLYAISVLILFIQTGFVSLNSFSPFMVVMISLFSFLCFNFRPKAKVFSGDVGSLSISYLLIGGLLQMLVKNGVSSNAFQFSLSLLVPLSFFMMDSFTTILHRLWLHENIFQSHRFHLYQMLTPGFISSHLTVSLIYAISQTLLTYFLCDLKDNRILILYLITLFSIFFLLRILLLRKANQPTGR